MTRAQAIVAAILAVLLAVPAGALVCEGGLCDPEVPCRRPMRPADAGDGPQLSGPSCCLSVAPSIAEPEVARPDARASVTPAVSAAPARSPVPDVRPSTPATRASMSARQGRVTLTLQSTLLL
jgi:hypothetical protein